MPKPVNPSLKAKLSGRRRKPEAREPQPMTTRQLYDELEHVRFQLQDALTKLNQITTIVGSRGLLVDGEPINEYTDIPF
jgi:hypothetical protein